MTTIRPRRVAARPDPQDWGADELMTLAEAAALLWPSGPLTASSRRTAYRAGALEVVMIARKLWSPRRRWRRGSPQRLIPFRFSDVALGFHCMTNES